MNRHVLQLYVYKDKARKFIRGRLCKYGMHNEDVDNVLQDVWLRVCTLPDSVTIQFPFTFLCAHCKWVISDKRIHYGNVLDAMNRVVSIDNITELQPACSDVESEIYVQQILEQAQTVLPRTHYDILTRYRLLGESQSEVAMTLHLSEHTVKKYVTQTNQLLQQRLRM